MANELSKNALSIFEQIKRLDKNINEYWSGRELAKVLEYSEYRHFKPVIEKAKEACKNSGQPVENHFEDYLEMVKIGSGAERPYDKYFDEQPRSGDNFVETENHKNNQAA